MSMPVTSRPTRRSRKRIVFDEDEDDVTGSNIESLITQGSILEEEQEYTPAPSTSPRKTRQSAADVKATPKASARRRQTCANAENVEPSAVFDPDTTTSETPSSPTKRASPRKRKSVAPSKVSRQSIAEESLSQLPTPHPSVTPEPSTGNMPLSDITTATINEQNITPPPEMIQEPIKIAANFTSLEKPMDIVLRTRALGIPKSVEAQGPKTRTVIRNLVLINFKSYAGRQEVGPFHSSFSSVVGPNGSGKSNVIDSLLFVFGFRASKMRQGKISSLIHNSAAFPDLDFCEVQVHFEEVTDAPGEKTEVLPDSQLVISRKAYKNNSSDYFMDGKRSNFTAVTSLLRGRGVDLDHKRFLILQGEVESIAQMKPKAGNEHEDGLLEYLEDIIGTSKYKTPIEESAHEVETLNEVCVEKSGRVQHVEKERNALEEKKNKALSFIREENDLTSKQASLYQIYMHECSDNLRVTEEAISQTQAKLDQELSKHKGSEDGIKRMEKACVKGQKQCALLEQDIQAILKDLAKSEKERVKFDEKKRFLANKQRKLEKSVNSSRLAGSEATSLIQKFTDDIERNDHEITGLETKLKAETASLADIRESLKGRTQAISDQIAVKQKQLEPWTEKVSQKESAIAVVQSELDILREKASAAAVALVELNDKIKTCGQSKNAKHQENEALAKEKISLERELKTVRQGILKIAESEPELRIQLTSSRQKADEARSSLASTQSRGNVLNGLMRLKDSGRIEGFHGRLGNLGAIDEKYDVAISTACPSLENLVVDTVEIGQQCIDYLRKNNLGRANFILLDRIARRDMAPLDTPENVPRLFDLVKAKDEMFKAAFYSVLQNTLVARNLEQANRIAYGARRWRVVTLDGQLIDVSGTMSGGGTHVARGAMSSKVVADVSQQAVDKLERDREEKETLFQEFQQKKMELESRAKELAGLIPALETKISKINLEVESFSKNVSDARRRILELENELQPSESDNTRIITLEKQLNELRKERDNIHGQSSGLQGEITVLQDKIMEIGGVQLRTQKAKVDGLKEQIDTLTEEMSNAEVSKSKATKDKVKHDKAFSQAQQDLQNMANELEQLDNETRAHSDAANEAKQKADAAKSALEDEQEELAIVKAELEGKTAELNETRAIEIEMRNKLEENHKIFAENQKRSKYWVEKLGKLKLTSVTNLGEKGQEGSETLPEYSADELQDMSKDELKADIAVLEEKLQNVHVDLDVLAEYRRRVEEHNARSMDLATAVSSRDAAKKRCDDLRRLRLEGFMEGFSLISLRLKEMYQMITMGGNAELELVDSLDPFSEGILFSVMPPKKSWKNISNLSGGEKTLSSLALVFALHHYKPTPLYVMDEIDAALDFRNVSIVASYIKERTKNAQFIVISLRNNMFELAARLVGVYKVNHMTKSVTIENRDYLRQ